MEQEQLTGSVKAVVQRRVNYREVFNYASWLAIGVLTPDGRVLEISKIVLDESDLQLEEVVGKPFAELPRWSHSTTDSNGRVWEANDAYLHMLGYTREDLARGTARSDATGNVSNRS